MILVQMHGEPGSGKTTLAGALAPRIPAIHLDKDVVMTAIMKTRIPREVAGPASYEAIWDITTSLLGQGHSVIVDSPVYWPVIEQNGRGLARELGIAYFMIETRCADTAEIDRRLREREGLATNPRQRHEWLATPGTRNPSRDRLTVDSSRPIPEMVECAMAYLSGAEGR